MWLRPLKKKRGASQPKVPQYIREQPGQEWEPYAALKRLRDTRQRRGIDPLAPLFRTRSGRAMSTGAYRALIKRVGRLSGIDPKKLGAHSTRIGGATDLASAAAEGGSDMAAAGASSELLLQAKGRWQSDAFRCSAGAFSPILRPTGRCTTCCTRSRGGQGVGHVAVARRAPER